MSWAEENNKLVKHYRFANFIEAFVFLNRVADLAEKHQHHPEIYNVYNQVTLSLSTHDAGDVVTQKDRDLAREIDQLKS